MAIFMWFFFLSLPITDFASGGFCRQWVGEGTGTRVWEEKVTRDLPAQSMPRNCSGGLDHCPLLTDSMFGSCVWTFPNPTVRIFISQPPGGLKVEACLKGPSLGTCYLVLELSAKQPSSLDTAWCCPSEQDRSAALCDVTPNKLRCLSRC